MEATLEGKTALVTGASKGIGKAISLAFAEAGADLVITARNSDLLQDTANQITNLGQRCEAITADLCDEESLKLIHKESLEAYGELDILVNNAGSGTIIALTDLTQKQFEQSLQLNTWVPFRLAQLFYPNMRENNGGVILNIASTGGIKPDVFAGAYSASKSALIMMTKQIACEWGNDGIRALAICPGLIRTEMTEDLVAYRESNGFQNLVYRAGEAEEVAALATFLASDSASFCQGSVHLVDGGSTVGTHWG